MVYLFTIIKTYSYYTRYAISGQIDLEFLLYLRVYEVLFVLFFFVLLLFWLKIDRFDSVVISVKKELGSWRTNHVDADVALNRMNNLNGTV